MFIFTDCRCVITRRTCETTSAGKYCTPTWKGFLKIIQRSSNNWRWMWQRLLSLSLFIYFLFFSQERVKINFSVIAGQLLIFHLVRFQRRATVVHALVLNKLALKNVIPMKKQTNKHILLASRPITALHLLHWLQLPINRAWRGLIWCWWGELRPINPLAPFHPPISVSGQ